MRAHKHAPMHESGGFRSDPLFALKGFAPSKFAPIFGRSFDLFYSLLSLVARVKYSRKSTTTNWNCKGHFIDVIQNYWEFPFINLVRGYRKHSFLEQINFIWRQPLFFLSSLTLKRQFFFLSGITRIYPTMSSLLNLMMRGKGRSFASFKKISFYQESLPWLAVSIAVKLKEIFLNLIIHKIYGMASCTYCDI